MNWKTLNASLPAVHVLKRLALHCCRIEGDSWRGACPVCQSSSRRPRSLAVSLSRRKWYCHSGKHHGDLIDLWALVRHCTPAEAARHLEEEFGA